MPADFHRIPKDSMSKPAKSPEAAAVRDMGDFIKSRRTINFFLPEPVPDELLLKAIKVARWAPNHKKTEPWHFHLLGDDARGRAIELITEIKAEGKAAKAAAVRKRLEDVPGWLVISSAVSDDAVRQMEDYAACSCAAQNMMLYLWRAGIGVKWTTGKVTRDERFFRILDIDPASRLIVGLFWYGYPQFVPGQSRRKTSEIVTKLD